MYQEEVVLYGVARSRSCRRARRLLRRKGYAFEEVDVGVDEGLLVSLSEVTGKKICCRSSSWAGAWWAASTRSKRWSAPVISSAWCGAEFRRSKLVWGQARERIGSAVRPLVNAVAISGWDVGKLGLR